MKQISPQKPSEAKLLKGLQVIYLARHGETAWSLSGQHTGRTDLPLTKRGECNARLLGDRLRGLGFACVFTSPLQRARRTCELAGFGPGAELDPDLTEWNYGDYEGLSTPDIHLRRPDWEMFRDGFPGGESFDQIGARADRVVNRVRSIDDVKGLRVSGDGPPTLLRDVASVQYGTTVGEVDRYDSQRVVSLTANLHDEYLGDAAKHVRQALQRVGNPPRGVTVAVRGQIPPLLETVSGLRTGLLLSMVVIFLLLTFNFQSLRIASIVLLTVPAVLCGVLAMLVITHTTLNVQSFMGAIMAVGVAVANAILLLTFAEFSRKNGAPSAEAAVEGGHNRSRAILMTAAAMIFGMIPMALGLTESGKQAAPLARAVIGGLMAATISTLFILPSIYAIIMGHARFRSPSLNPYDPESRYHENA